MAVRGLDWTAYIRQGGQRRIAPLALCVNRISPCARGLALASSLILPRTTVCKIACIPFIPDGLGVALAGLYLVFRLLL
jgi:hypothetical protein